MKSPLTANALLLSLLLVCPSVLSSGFVCISPKGQLKIKLLFYVHPAKGTRTASVMVLSNPKAPKGKKTIAAFHVDTGTLVQNSGVYTGLFQAGTKGQKYSQRNIGPLPQASMKFLSISPDFNYSEPIEHGSPLFARFYLEFNDGTAPIQGNIRCVRYLKQAKKGVPQVSALCQEKLENP